MPNVSPIVADAAAATGTPPIVVGFSVRALAEAVAAWGARPFVIDHFNDHDCRELAYSWYQIVKWGDNCQPLAAWLQRSEALSRRASRPWALLGGGTENWPELLALLRQHFRLLGPTAEQLRLLRSVDFWRQVVAESGICFPETHAAPPHVTASNQYHSTASADWLVKPTRGAGGYSIERWTNAEPPAPAERTPLHPVNYQRQIVGRSLGAYCILTADDVRLLGATESWTGEHWPAPREFIYRGSWGPISLAPQQIAQIEQLCRQIQSATGCLGWLQLDFIEEPSGQLWLLELNPRWAAGMEILYLAGINPVAYHLAAWQVTRDRSPLEALPITTAQGTSMATAYGKAVVYADRPLQLTSDNIARLHGLPRANYVDLPALELAGECIATGQPLLTVRTGGEARMDQTATRASLLRQLQHLSEHALSVLHLGGTGFASGFEV